MEQNVTQGPISENRRPEKSASKAWLSVNIGCKQTHTLKVSEWGVGEETCPSFLMKWKRKTNKTKQKQNIPKTLW